MGDHLTKTDLEAVRTVVRDEISHEVPAVVERMTTPAFQAIQEDLTILKNSIDHLTTTADEFITFARRHDEELIVLRAQSERIRDVLVKKGIATEDELSVLHSAGR